jgi:hypothetical protein
MIPYNSLGSSLAQVAICYLALLAMCWAIARLRSRSLELPDVTPMSRPEELREMAALRRCQRRAALLWRCGALLSGGRRAWVENLSRQYTDRAQRIEKARRSRAQDAGRLDAQARAWAAHMTPIPGSSPCSPPNPPPSAPRPTLDQAKESTRRWERTLPWGTPSPLVTREGLGRPYPFVPLAPPLPPAAPRSSRRARRNP